MLQHTHAHTANEENENEMKKEVRKLYVKMKSNLM